jgi:hypothetical protein
MMAAAKLDEYWSHLRLSQTDLPGRKFLLQAQEAYQRVSVQRQTVVEVAHEEAKLVSPRLAEALVRYVGQKGAGRVDTFRRAAERACWLSAFSAHGTVRPDCVAEGLRLIFIPYGVEDDEEPK